MKQASVWTGVQTW